MRALSVLDTNSGPGMKETFCDDFGKKTVDAAPRPGWNPQVVFQGLMFLMMLELASLVTFVLIHRQIQALPVLKATPC